MSKKGSIEWKKFEKFLLFVGCTFDREKGDHRIYWRDDLKRPIVIPRCNPLPLFIIRNNLRILNMTIDEFATILGQL
ncbi:hypothetical protein A2333_00835 [Candidatus Wolfebacteria bacterium RIFOXYB2_FULL_49_7]|uniref:Addiction module toxin, HicA family n=1 Tax=Candidatus Wolfebacteria bacterium RIFOXYB1_FULL_54_12 TaxID=1802559 RepID=A0A1F8DW72_9BACT|nr:MAG: hypothetical protein A2372_00605 [Candidatus Wolfebacteria bacterium RIFOXYB1_FULL_54_12]OGM94148.1 MAG: hypothetical protein A2333_00835 [Candidatus Wolfebacteria bacterium RIFOXYB2_FULL_49_7]